jgi:hypothetical protein
MTTATTDTRELTDEQIRIMAEFIVGIEAGNPAHAVHYADDIQEVAEVIETTRDAFDRYDGRVWREASSPEDEVREGYPARHFAQVQAAKGQQRYELWVIDFGDVRAIYQI